MKSKSLRKLMKRVKTVVNKDMATDEIDPYFLRKAEEARKNFEKYRIAEQLVEWKKNNPTEAKKLHKEVIKNLEKCELKLRNIKEGG